MSATLSATRRPLHLALAVSLACTWLVGAAACRRAAAPATPQATPPATIASATPVPQSTRTKPEKGGSIAVAIQEPPGPLNFSLARTDAAHWILDTVDAPMLQLTPSGDYQPQLLEVVPQPDNGGVSPDGLTWTLHFRAKLSWSDGQTLDANDFKFTWQTLINARYPAVARGGWTNIDSVAVSSDGLTAAVALRRPDPGFLDDVLADTETEVGGFLLPEHLLSGLPVDLIPADDYSGAGHVGSGPFKVVKVDANGQVTVDRNDRFNGNAALLDRIVFRVVADPRDALGDLGSGELDLAPNVPAAYLPTLDQLPTTQTVSAMKSGAVAMLAFNVQQSPLDTQAVRQAIALGFNRVQVAAMLVPGSPPLATTPLAATPWAAQVSIPYDPDQAARLLDAAGWTRQPDGVRARFGQRLSFTISTLAGNDPDASLRQRLQDAFIADMARLGIEVVPRQLDSSALATAVATGDFDCTLLWDDQRSGLDEFEQRFSSAGIGATTEAEANVMHYINATVDSALAQAATARTRSDELAALQQAQQQIAHDMPVIPLFVHREVDAAQSHVQGLDPGDRTGIWWNVEDWWLQRDQKAP